MAKDDNAMTPLKEVIDDLFKSGHLPIDPGDADIWKVWEEVVGPGISKHTRPAWIKQGKLRVTVSDHIWLQELKFLEEDVRQRLNRRLGRKAVTQIEFRVGPI